MSASFIVVRISFGIRPVCQTDYGSKRLGREVIATALAVQNLCWGIVAVFAGGMADRFGNVKVIVAGTIRYKFLTFHFAIS